MRPAFATHLLPVLLVLGGVAAGCAPSARLTEAEQQVVRQNAALDSLRAVNEALRAERATLHDSLRFYDDIYSGQYYRDRRRLQNRIDQLTYDLALARDGGRTVATLQADALFQSASAVLTEAGKARIAALADTLAENFDEGRAFRIEGHADDVPLSPELRKTYPSNWELSAARAAAVLRQLTGAHDLSADRFALAAYGATQPTARNNTQAGRRQNRRVRITVLPEMPTP